MAVNRRLEQLERNVRSRCTVGGAQRRHEPASTAAPLCHRSDAAPPPHTLDIPRCDVCELRHLGAVYAIMEDSEPGRAGRSSGTWRGMALARTRRCSASDDSIRATHRLALRRGFSWSPSRSPTWELTRRINRRSSGSSKPSRWPGGGSATNLPTRRGATPPAAPSRCQATCSVSSDSSDRARSPGIRTPIRDPPGCGASAPAGRSCTVARSDPNARGLMPPPGLGASSVNKLLKLGGQVMDDAIEAEWIDTNPFRGKRHRLRAARPRRTWLSLPELQALLRASGTHWTFDCDDGSRRLASR